MTSYTTDTASLHLSPPVTWKPILSVPVTWAATEHARARPPPTPAPFRPRTRARAPPPHVGVSPPPPPGHPLPALYSKSGSRAECTPGSLFLSHFPSPASGPHHVPRAPLTFLAEQVSAGHSGRCRRRGRSPPPPHHLLGWPPPQEAGRRGRGASRWVPASRSCHFPQYQRLLPVPSSLLVAGTGWRRWLQARSLHRLLVTAADAAPAGGGLPRPTPAIRSGPGARAGLRAGPSPCLAGVSRGPTQVGKASS